MALPAQNFVDFSPPAPSAAWLNAVDTMRLQGLPGLFNSTTAGIVPASGGGTTNFLRADGTWAAPVSGFQPIYSQIAADAVWTSNTTLAVNGNTSGSMPQVSVVAGHYEFELLHFAFSGGGIQFDLNGGNAAVSAVTYGIQYFSTSDNGNVGATLITTVQTFSPSIQSTAATPSWFHLRGFVTFSGSGTFGPRAAQAISSSSALHVLAGSFLKLAQIS